MSGVARTTARERLRTRAKRSLRRAFELGQRAGFDLLPRHFYSEIPAIADLRNQATWRGPRYMGSVAGADIADQLAFLESCCQPVILSSMPPALYGMACAENGAVGFGEIEALFLYCFILSRRPPRVVQIGCGVSTAIILRAARAINHAIDITCIEPYPTAFLIDADRHGHVDLVQEKAQDVDLSLLMSVTPGDLLFIDSTHTVKPGSEVNRAVLDVLPRLSLGTYVHFHDITFPYDYYPSILTTDLFFWSESTLVHAFLAGNCRYTLKLALSMIHHSAPTALRTRFPSYRPARFEEGLLLDELGPVHFPSSAYVEVTG